MSLFIDHKYIAQIGSRLEKFKRKNQRTYNFRCPLCGDSSKSKIKARGYFISKGTNMMFYCHNCLRNISFSNFLKEFDVQLYDQYIFERYASGENGHSNYEKPTFSEFNFKPDFKIHPPESVNSDILANYHNITNLPNDHFAKSYIRDRKIPTIFWNDILFVPDFKILVDQLEPDNEYELKTEDPRIVIPFRDADKKLTAIQGRSFSKKGVRYITIKIDKDAPKIYGLDRVCPTDRVYIVEGPFDAMFLPNAIAAAGSNLGYKALSNFNDMVYIFDNEPRNKAIVDLMTKVADNDKKICIWPNTIGEKDINDMILRGLTSEQIKLIIDINTYQGLEARFAISEWKKC